MSQDEDDKIKLGSEVLGTFLAVNDAKFGEKVIAGMKFEVYVMVHRTNNVRVVFLTLANNIEWTFSTIGSNQTNDKMWEFFKLGWKKLKKKKTKDLSISLP